MKHYPLLHSQQGEIEIIQKNSDHMGIGMNGTYYASYLELINGIRC